MAKFRLGKHEKWVLITCFKKTKLFELPVDWYLPRTIPKSYMDEYNERFWNYLYKSEILMNYFNLKFFHQKESYEFGTEYFCASGYGVWVDGEYKGFTDEQWDEIRRVEKIRVNYSRLKRSLITKGLIDVMDGPLNSDRITLTEKGETKAQELLDSKC